MKAVSYYPGCSLEASARDYAESVTGVAQMLGLELAELEDWNCCGASAAHSLDHRASLNLAGRNLVLAARAPQPLVVPCALCFNRLKTAQSDLNREPGLLLPEIAALGGDCQAVDVVELNSFLAGAQMRELILAKARRSLEGLKVVCYYGCQGQRPPKVTGHPQAENPTSLDQLLSDLGAQVIDWSYKTDCCGASHSVPRPDLVHALVGKLYKHAQAAGSDCLVTGCQMCQANLDLYQADIAALEGREIYLPTFYMTELVGLALEHPQAGRWLSRHMVDAMPLLQRAGIKA